jgi:hypothetical protein
MFGQQGITQVEQRSTCPHEAGVNVAAEVREFGTIHGGISFWFGHQDDTPAGSLTQVGLPQIV